MFNVDALRAALANLLQIADDEQLLSVLDSVGVTNRIARHIIALKLVAASEDDPEERKRKRARTRSTRGSVNNSVSRGGYALRAKRAEGTLSESDPGSDGSIQSDSDDEYSDRDTSVDMGDIYDAADRSDQDVEVEAPFAHTLCTFIRGLYGLPDWRHNAAYGSGEWLSIDFVILHLRGDDRDVSDALKESGYANIEELLLASCGQTVTWTSLVAKEQAHAGREAGAPKATGIDGLASKFINNSWHFMFDEGSAASADAATTSGGIKAGKKPASSEEEYVPRRGPPSSSEEEEDEDDAIDALFIDKEGADAEDAPDVDFEPTEVDPVLTKRGRARVQEENDNGAARATAAGLKYVSRSYADIIEPMQVVDTLCTNIKEVKAALKRAALEGKNPCAHCGPLADHVISHCPTRKCGWCDRKRSAVCRTPRTQFLRLHGTACAWALWARHNLQLLNVSEFGVVKLWLSKKAGVAAQQYAADVSKGRDRMPDGRPRAATV